MADPTLQRKFYSDAKRVKSSASNQLARKNHKDGPLAGISYSQGTSAKNLMSARTAGPIIGRSGVKSTRVHRIADGSASNRTIIDVEDLQENNYFIDLPRLCRARYTRSAELTTPTRDQVKAFRLPDGKLLGGEELKDVFFVNMLKDLPSDFDFSGPIPIPAVYRSFFNEYTSMHLVADLTQKVNVVFPNGGIVEVADYSLRSENYGYGSDYRKDTPFTELQKFDAVEFVRQNSPLGMFPETSKSDSFNDDQIYNGIIEPFNIREKLYGKSIFATSDQKPGDLSGDAQQIPDFSFSVLENLKSAFAMYEDVVVPAGDVATLEQFYVSETKYSTDPYQDRDSYDAVYVDEELEKVLISMDKTLDEGNLSVQYVDMAVGFTSRAKDRFGSINYRGLMR